MTNKAMDILFYGAGVIGSIYAAHLHNSGHPITMLARGQRLVDIQEHGIILENANSRTRSVSRVKTTDKLGPSDYYDFIVVAVRKNQLADILPVLSENKICPNILLMVNNPSGYEDITRWLGPERVIIGFPGAGGTGDKQVVRYTLAPRFIQPTTFGEINGQLTDRLKNISDIFKKAGFAVAVTHNIEAWQKSHVAWVSPVANALYLANGDNYQLAKEPNTIRLLIKAVREGFSVLHALGIPITPSILRFWQQIPTPLLSTILMAVLNTAFAENIIAKHANSARDEMKQLADEFTKLAAVASIDTPTMDHLKSFI